MRGTSSPDDKLADDPGNAIEGTRISGRRSDFSTAGKLASDDLGLLQQYLPQGDLSRCSKQTYSITLSARSRKDSGIVRPRTLAVLRLMTSSNFVGCSTGKSAGLPPSRILATKSAVRRNISGASGPYDISAPASVNDRAIVAAGRRCLSASSAAFLDAKLPC